VIVGEGEGVAEGLGDGDAVTTTATVGEGDVVAGGAQVATRRDAHARTNARRTVAHDR
jgi:hypothetical protein